MKLIIYFLLNNRIFVPFAYSSCVIIGIFIALIWQFPWWVGLLFGLLILPACELICRIAQQLKYVFSRHYSTIKLAWQEAKYRYEATKQSSKKIN